MIMNETDYNEMRWNRKPSQETAETENGQLALNYLPVELKTIADTSVLERLFTIGNPIWAINAIDKNKFFQLQLREQNIVNCTSLSRLPWQSFAKWYLEWKYYFMKNNYNLLGLLTFQFYNRIWSNCVFHDGNRF